VNGDGLDDILISAVSDDDAAEFAGQTYLVLGKKNGWHMGMTLSNADASFLGEDEDDYSGTSIAGVGDVNGDGYDDILIGARGNDEESRDAGQAYLIIGSPDGWVMDADLKWSYASYLGERRNDHAGSTVAGAGDVNGDGFADFLIGATGSDRWGEDTGETYLILGSRYGFQMDTDLGESDASFYGESPGSWSATAIAGAGDVNGDGLDDFLIGALFNDEGGPSAGQTYLFFGRTEGWSLDTNLSEADASFIGENEQDSAGFSISGAGDVNGDGFDDFLIGSRFNGDGGSISGQTYLVFGKASGWSMDTNLSLADASFWGENEGDYSGQSVAGVGDFNGDGYDDFLIGASNNGDKASHCGQSYLILGRASGWSMDTRLSVSNASFWGEAKGDESGSSVAGAGDVNGDGYDDILIGAPFNNKAGESAGQAYLIFASVKTDPPQVDDDPWERVLPLILLAVGAIIVVVYFLRRRK